MLNPNVEVPPPSMAHLPIDPVRGYPVPWFVPWIDGKPEFRMAHGAKLVTAVKQNRCWVCGGRHEPGRVTYVIGPMCGINRTAGDPPSHLACARYSVKNCPFLVRPAMERRQHEEVAAMGDCAGFAIMRNPGISLLWTCESVRVFDDGDGRPLFRVGEPLAIEWWAEGRAATRQEVLASVESGLPILASAAAREGGGATAELERRRRDFLSLLPAEEASDGW